MHDEVDLDLRVGSEDDAGGELYRVIDAATLDATAPGSALGLGLVTGLSVVVTESDDAAEAHVDAATRWAPAEMRVELVLADPPRSLTARLDQLAWPWSAVTLPWRGGSVPDRIVTLDAATARAGGELVVLASSGDGDPSPLFGRLSAALGSMWVNGADAMVIDGAPAAPTPPDSDQPDGDQRDSRSAAEDRVERLVGALGLGRSAASSPGGNLVVLRRWVARFLFEEIGGAIDPIHELAERIRLLELRLLVLVDRG